MNQRSADEWEWEHEGRHYSVRVFEKTGRLIWSSWAQTSMGAMFDDGYAQQFARFLEGEVPRPAPPELIAALRKRLGAV
jgi:hypothetical protein